MSWHFKHGEVMLYSQGEPEDLIVPPQFVIVLREMRQNTYLVLLASGRQITVYAKNLKYPAIPT